MNAPLRRCYRSKWERLLGETESPIESAFLAAFCEAAFECGYEIARTPLNDATIGVETQKVIDIHRVDFAVSFVFRTAGLYLIVETDGHDFHHATRAQVKRDKRRDRDLIALGYQVIRFSGTEIHENATWCAMEVLNLIMSHQTAQIVKAMEAF